VSLQHQELLKCMNGCLLVDIPATIDANEWNSLSHDVLAHLETQYDDAVVINLQQLRVSETSLLQGLQNMLRMINIMGIPVVLAGMQAGMITALVHLDIDMGQAKFAKNIERAIQVLRSKRA